MRTISVAALRRLVVAAQGYLPRTRRASAEEVASAIGRASCIQLDTISTVERSHRVAIATRAGVYPPGAVAKLLREGRIIEYWVHALCVLPAEDWPPVLGYSGLAERVLVEIRERGALGSRDFTGKPDPAPHRAGTSSEAIWSWKPANAPICPPG